VSKDYEKTYADFWRDIVELPDGSLNRDQVMRELHDYHEQMEQVSLAYDDVTGGRMSKPNTAARHVMAAVSERIDEAVRDMALEIAERLVAEGYPECAAIARDVGGLEPGDETTEAAR
jgi:hypothetical protein